MLSIWKGRAWRATINRVDAENLLFYYSLLRVFNKKGHVRSSSRRCVSHKSRCSDVFWSVSDFRQRTERERERKEPSFLWELLLHSDRMRWLGCDFFPGGKMADSCIDFNVRYCAYSDENVCWEMVWMRKSTTTRVFTRSNQTLSISCYRSNRWNKIPRYFPTQRPLRGEAQ